MKTLPFLAMLAALTMGAGPAAAQGFPNRPITLITPLTAGSNVEIAIRSISAEASKTLGQPVIVDNRPGANGRLGTAAMRKSPADGYLLAVATDGLLVSQPIVDANFKMEIGKDYSPLALLMSFPLVLASNAALPYRDIGGLITYAKANPGKINVAVSQGSVALFTAEMFRQVAGIEVTMVPYKDTQQALPDLGQGRVDLMFTGTIAKPHMDAGRVVGIATTGRTRWGPFPNLPTLVEGGLNVESTAWFSVIAHPDTPADIASKLNTAFTTALKAPAIVNQLGTYGMNPGSQLNAEQFGAYVRAQVDTWGPVLRKAGIRME